VTALPAVPRRAAQGQVGHNDPTPQENRSR
jgi:hypothetical protein